MKRILLLLISIVAVVSCYDDGPIWDELQDHENRIVALETLCAQMNTNITSLQTIVTALQSNDYVTAVAPIKEGDKVIGYTITFNKAGSVTIYNGADGADGKDGAAAKAPVIGVRQDTDDAYYWTIDGEWLLDEKGNKVKASASDGEAGADGQTPQLDLKEGYWWVSYDGKEWTKLGVASGSSNLVDVRLEGSFIYLTLDNETVLKIPMSIGVPDMTVESGYERLIFRGKANPVSPDFVVGAFVSSEMDELKGMIPLGVEESNGYAYDFGEDGSFAFGAELYDDGREGMEFYYYTFVYANGVFSFSELKTIRFEANQAELAYGITNITETSVTFKGKVTLKRPADITVFMTERYNDIYDVDDLDSSR